MFSRFAVWGLVLAVVIGIIPARAAQQVETSAPTTTAVAPAVAPAVVPSAPPTITLSLASRYVAQNAEFEGGAAEIVAHDPESQRLFIVNGQIKGIDVVSVSNPLTPTLVYTLTSDVGFDGYTSVAVYNPPGADNSIVAAASPADPETGNGQVVFFNPRAADAAGARLGSVPVGALPDMVTFTPDGNYVLTANEGQPNSYGETGSIDPVGSVSIIDISGGVGSATVATAGFAAFNGQEQTLRNQGIRIFGPGATAAQDFEPEYIAVSPNSQTAYVTLQENNALAIVDIATATVGAVLPLGLKDHNAANNGIDASDRDNRVNIANWPVRGMYMPDGIAAYESGGQLYLVTANEGDAREYEGLEEEESVGDLTLDTGVFTDAATLQANENLGRLNVTKFLTSTEVTTFTELYAFGARSFTIWNASSGAVVFDSGDDLEQRTAAIYGQNFNASNSNNNFDNRSDNKGPEPEGVTLGTINGRTYAFIGLERIGGVMVYDVTTPATPTFVQYINNRNFAKDPEDELAEAGDLGPEGLIFVKAEDSPVPNTPLLIVANEISGSTSIYTINTVASPDGAGSLSLLHNNDGESTLLPLTRTVAPTAGYSNTTTETITIQGVAAFKAVTDREIAAARNAGNAVMNVYAGDAFLASAALQCTLDSPTGPVYDAIAQAAIPYTAHILGNHEFDYSPDFLKRFIDAFGGTQPFLSANLNFSGEPSYAALLDADGVIFSPISDGRVIGGSLVYTDTATNQRFGLVGFITPGLPTISSPRNVTVTSPTISETAQVVQAAIDNLYNNLGVRKIIVVSHLQDIDNDIEILGLLRRVDLAVAGGGDDLLVSPLRDLTDQLLPGDSPATEGGNPRPYPLPVQDADGRTVYVVTSDGNYKYLGRLDVVFDAQGEVADVIAEQSYPRRVVVANAAAEEVGLSDAVTPDAGLVSSVETPIEACTDAYANTPLARSEVTLDVSRNGVRGKETNAGNLVADAFLDAYRKYADNVGVTTPITRVVALQNGGGIRQNAGDRLPRTGAPGTISRLDTIDVLPFDNFVTAVLNVTPAELKLILERSASALPGTGGQFLQVGGMKVVYITRNQAHVVSAPPTGENAGTVTTAGSRVWSVTLNDGTKIIEAGQVVTGAPSVTLVTNNFTARGGDNYAAFEDTPQADKKNLIDDGGVAISYEQAWREYLLSFPVGGSPSLPTIAASDTRYAPGGEGRILILGRSLYHPMIFTPTP